jgi:hypothetical protein
VVYLAMVYVEGSDLRQLLRREGSLEPARAIALIGQVGEALDAAQRSRGPRCKPTVFAVPERSSTTRRRNSRLSCSRVNELDPLREFTARAP